MRASFSKKYKGMLAAGVAAPAICFGGAMAQPSLEISEYRIQSDDCGLNACGMPEFTSEADASAFFAGDLATRQARASGAGGAPGYLKWRRNYNPYGRGEKQTVFLDFDAGGLPTFPVCFTNGAVFGVFNDYVYSQEERDAIQSRIAADYAKFDYKFTQTEPSVGEYSTLLIGLNDAPLDCSQGSNIQLTPTGGLSILFGRAENIDFRNQSKTDAAFADASLWAFLAQFDALAGTNNLGNLSGIPTTPETRAEVLSLAVLNQTSNTGAHELGHIQGLRHHDSIGAPGDGLPASGVPNPNSFIPVFTGPQDADETPLHIMASGASVGLTLTGSTITDRFFAERSAVKLSIARNAERVLEEDFFEKSFWGKKRTRIMPLLPFYVPNTLVEGDNAGSRRLDADGLVIAGAIGEVGEVDEYMFFAKKGKFVNIEMVSFSDDRFVNPVIGAMKLSKVNWDGTRTEVASNIQTFEPFDPLIFDQELPESGVYVVEIDAPNIVYIDLNGDGVPDPFPLEETGNGSLRAGDYEIAIYSVDGKMGRPRGYDFYKQRRPYQSAWKN